jgi:hypothetical protein
MTEGTAHMAFICTSPRVSSPRDACLPICAIRPTQFPPLAVAAAGFLDGGTAGSRRRAELGEWWSLEAPLRLKWGRMNVVITKVRASFVVDLAHTDAHRA